MKFMLLGSVRAVDGAREIEIPRRQVRCLLGLLLLEAGRTVQADRLIDLLWDREPPPRARSVLQTYVGRLRALLAPHGVAFQNSAGGYRIDVDPLEVDAHLFRHLIAEALVARDAAARADRTAEALALWSGPLLADAASERLRERVGASLEDARVRAVEQYAFESLAAGRPDDAIDALAELVTDNPLRERSAALLIAAYARAGRRGEALSRYREVRDATVDQLGLEPSAELRALHERILRESPQHSVGSRSESIDDAEPSPRTVPRELVAPPLRYVGREAERRRLADALLAADPADRRARTVTISGRGGVGKSALAQVVAHQVAHHFPDGQIYLDTGGGTPGAPRLDVLDVLRHLLRGVGALAPESSETAGAAAARWRSETADRRLLIVLDNVASPELVRETVPGAGGCAIIVAGRAGYSSLDADVHLALDGLSEPDALDLLVRHAGRKGNVAAGRRIVRLCESLPLALRIAAGRLASRPDMTYTDMADRLADEQSRLDELDLQGLAVRSSINVGFADLPDAADPADRLAAEAFARMGVLAAPVMSPAYVASLLGRQQVAGVRAALDRLVDLHLARAMPNDRYGMHDLVRLYAQEIAATRLDPAERRAAVDRALTHYVLTSRAACEHLFPGRGPSGPEFEPRDDVAIPMFTSSADASRWLDAELAAMLAVAESQATSDVPSPRPMFAYHLARALIWILGKRADWLGERQLGRLAVAAAEGHGTEIEHATALRLLGDAEMHLSNISDADVLLKRSLAIATEVGDMGLVPGLLMDLARTAMLNDDLENAMAMCLDALAACRSAGLVRAQGVALLNLSSIYVSLDRLDDARDALLESLAIRREADDAAGLAIVVPSLASVYLLLGEFQVARRHYDEAVVACERVGNTVDGWLSRFGRSMVFAIEGHHRAAVHDACAALRLCQKIRAHETAASLALLQMVSVASGHPARAAEFKERAVQAYANLDGHVEQQIESMLAVGRKALGVAALS